MEFSRRRKKNIGKLWTIEDVQLLTDYIVRDMIVYDELTKVFPNRSLQAIRNKIRKIRLSESLFGSSYKDAKQVFTLSIAKDLRPDSVFEAYAGTGFQSIKWSKYARKVFCSERVFKKCEGFRNEIIDNGYKEFISQNSMWKRYSKNGHRIWYANVDAIKAATAISYEFGKIDLLDLDTCGTTLPTLPTFLSLLSPKYVVITHGEFHSLRFKREDVLRRVLNHLGIDKPILPMTNSELCDALDKSVKLYALRSHNETTKSFWLELVKEKWLGAKGRGMLRRVYKVTRPQSTADCLNELING